MRHRNDIDLLRAIAVLSVLGFHAELPGLKGGFIGVDVFFVISGFLITSIIRKDLETGTFSIADFYKRRVHRIFPALFLVMAVTAAISMLVLPPSELARFGKSVIATCLFGSNLLFYGETGYFDADALVKPLLHTWSLAIEEQYYVVWPLLLMLFHRLKWKIGWCALALTVVSLGFAIFTLPRDASAAFYLLPSRAWELLIGALPALGVFPKFQRAWTRHLAASVGLALILVPIKFYNAQVPFPGLAALPPCLGAALVIAAGQEGDTVAGRIAAIPPLRWIGLISYSLYLWHWPVIVFAKIGLYLPFSPPVQAGIIATAIGLAYLSWRFVEQPFQKNRATTPTGVSLGVAVATMVIGCGAGAAAVLDHGAPWRYSPQQQKIVAYTEYDGDGFYRGGQCFLVSPADHYDRATCLKRTPGKPAIVLIGDSHAAHLWPGLKTYAGQADILQITSSGCKPLVGRYETGVPHCAALMGEAFGKVLPQTRPDTIILAARWNDYDMGALSQTLARLKPLARRVVLVGPAPQYETALPRLLLRADQTHDAGLPGRHMAPGLRALDARARSIAAGQGVAYVSLMETLCPASGCETFAAPGVPLQFDYGHFTVEGSRLAVPPVARAAGLADGLADAPNRLAR